MEDKHGDILQNTGVSNLHGIKGRLRSMAPEHILSELVEMTKQAESTGQELDANIILAYYDVLDEVNPIEIPADANERSLARFAQEHPEYLSPATLETTSAPSHKHSRSFIQYFKLHPVAAVLAMLLLLSCGTVAVALDLPQRVILWGQETFQIRPTSGDMLVENPAEGEYTSLEDALAAYGVQTYTPVWVPETVRLKKVTVLETNSWNAFLATYISNDTEEEIGIIKIIDYLNMADVPYLEFEDNGEDGRTTIIVDDFPVNVTMNYGSARASWTYGNCSGNISGEFTEAEVKQIAQSLNMKGP